MSKTATTWQLMKDSWGVLMRDKELIVFPIVSSLAKLWLSSCCDEAV